MENFITTNFKEAVNFMVSRIAYYEEIDEPTDWECHLHVGFPNGEEATMWIKALTEDYFDTLIEEEQHGGCRITYPMDLDELEKLLVNPNHTYQFICGPIWDGNMPKY